ncbi:hypothetical protein NQ314_012387 [Rhamnusium bicolor]|uniref:Uncharacterized protein n=1 Tax=Rhamnusium bicolor TaxID=1586634 RepID=A0AAV8XC49_9CUCU|nr:hypothetical protein NQ314_012387 [Rhamnusium bicolor]
MLYNSPVNSRRSSSDRFIPRRANANFDLSYYYIKKTPDIHNIKYSESDCFVNTAKYFYNLKQYRSESYKTTTVMSCQCMFKGCVVTSMEWTRDNHLITGCSEGRLCSWSPDFICIKTYFLAHVGDIINIKCSCNGNYLATTGLDKVVRVWRWPEFVEHFEIAFSRSPVKGVAWHPWRDSLLAIGGPLLTQLWNANTQSAIDYKPHPHKNSLIDTLTFNPLSGELVVSETKQS